MHGTIDRLVPERAFGFVAGDDGREYFFQAGGLMGALHIRKRHRSQSHGQSGSASQRWSEFVEATRTREVPWAESSRSQPADYDAVVQEEGDVRQGGVRALVQDGR